MNLSNASHLSAVIPAKAGTHGLSSGVQEIRKEPRPWIPAFAGMTDRSPTELSAVIPAKAGTDGSTTELSAVIPAKAGTHGLFLGTQEIQKPPRPWIPACAGMTDRWTSSPGVAA